MLRAPLALLLLCWSSLAKHHVKSSSSAIKSPPCASSQSLSLNTQLACCVLLSLPRFCMQKSVRLVPGVTLDLIEK